MCSYCLTTDKLGQRTMVCGGLYLKYTPHISVLIDLGCKRWVTGNVTWKGVLSVLAAHFSVSWLSLGEHLSFTMLFTRPSLSAAATQRQNLLKLGAKIIFSLFKLKVLKIVSQWCESI